MKMVCAATGGAMNSADSLAHSSLCASRRFTSPTLMRMF